MVVMVMIVMTMAVIDSALHDTNDIKVPHLNKLRQHHAVPVPGEIVTKSRWRCEAFAYWSASSPKPISIPIASAAAAAVWWVEDGRGGASGGGCMRC
jgi:hypothetical protein